MTTSEELIEIAKAASEILDEEQLNQIIELAPKITDEERDQLKASLFALAEKEVKASELELALWRQIAAGHKDDARKQMAENEASEIEADLKAADELLKNL